MLVDDRQRLVDLLKELDFTTVGQRTRVMQELRSATHVDDEPPPAIVTLVCMVDDEERKLTAKLNDTWVRQPVKRLLLHFASKNMSDLSIDDETLRLLSIDGSNRVVISSDLTIGDALVDRCAYQVFARPPRDDFGTGNPYFLPLEDAATREALKRRDPRDLIALDAEPPPRFQVDDERAYAYLEEHGYVVIADAIGGAAELREARRLFWEYVERLHVDEVSAEEEEAAAAAAAAASTEEEGAAAPIDVGDADSDHGAKAEAEVAPTRPPKRVRVSRHDPRTWDWTANPINGILGVGGIGQSPFLWHVRTRPRVVEAFARVWGTPELITSFDGCSAFRPFETCARWRTMGGWWHVDQNAIGKVPRNGLAAVQGLVSMYDQDEATGAFAVLPGTHKEFGELCDRYAPRVRGANQFIPLRGNDPLLRGDGRSARIVSCRAGDLVLWDSRCVHCSMPARQGARRDDESDRGDGGDEDDEDDEGERGGGSGEGVALGRAPARLLRLVAYVCMLPRERASSEVLRNRLQLWHFGATTTHWPDAWEAMFPEQRPAPPPSAKSTTAAAAAEMVAAGEGGTEAAAAKAATAAKAKEVKEEEEEEEEEACDGGGEDGESELASPLWDPLELADLGSRSAIELLGWRNVPEDFYQAPPTLAELRVMWQSASAPAK